MPEEPSFDAAAAIARLGGDVALFRRIGAMFLAQQETLLGAVRVAAETANAEALERTAHALKGAVANFGAEGVQAAAEVLEQRGRAGELSDLGADLDTLEANLTQFAAELTTHVDVDE
ncbi:MAG: Hpt domain-containing protein [Planctomycetota bacterium]|nr:Hpt domain-containing protein [Planctomycetota bacterium]